MLLSAPLFGQNRFRGFIKDEVTRDPVLGASVYFDSLKIGAAASDRGLVVVDGIPDGRYSARFSCIGYETKYVSLVFPLKDTSKAKTYFLKPEALQGEEVVVLASSRNNGTKADSPVRVEVLGQEEVNEEIAIRPGNISKLLSETSGIQVQQTSAISGNVSFRLQGLPGAYTQLLKDGFPYFSGFSSGLSLLQIPPLDLRQVEVIQGPFSTLYGDGAVAGIVNLISREPGDEPEWDLILNLTNKKGGDISSFYSRKSDNSGITFLANESIQDAVDVDGDGITDIPYFRQVSLSPRLFYLFHDSSSMMVGVSSFFESRRGGDISAVDFGRDSLHTYLESESSDRINTQLRYDKKTSNRGEFTLKGSFSYFGRDIGLSDYNFSGRQLNSYSELSYLLRRRQHSLVLGLDISTDSFKKEKGSASGFEGHDYYSLDSFAQDDWNISSKISIQPGFRFDYHSKYDGFPMPHLSFLYKIVKNGSIRLSSGLGYEIPSLMNLVSDADLVKGAATLSPDIKSQISRGVSVDLAYKYIRGEFSAAIDQAFFATYVKNAIIPDYFPEGGTALVYNNANSSILSKGLDTNLNIAYDELNLFIDYSHVDPKSTVAGRTLPLFLTPRDKLNITGTFESEGSWRTGIEAFYTGRQYLDAGRKSRDFWLFGIMLEKSYKSISLIGNIENLFDERQSRHGPIFLPPVGSPTFLPVYEPLDGIVANVALKLQL